MDIMRVNYDANTRAGAFIAIPSLSGDELPKKPTSFALVQICRIREKDIVVTNPSLPLHWGQDPVRNRIKQETLDQETGWFIDNFLQQPHHQENCVYYMESFPQEWGLLQTLTAQGDANGGIIYLDNGAQQGVPGGTFTADYRQPTVTVGRQCGQYPMLLDSPGDQPDNRFLDFEVHLVYQNDAGETKAVKISKGFSWTFNVHVSSKFNGFLGQPSAHFKRCMARVVEFQNDINKTNWKLIID